MKKIFSNMNFLVCAFVFGLVCAGVVAHNRRMRKCMHTIAQLDGASNLVPLLIVGSGPAGLSAAIYGTRLKRNTVVFEGPKPGGLLTETSAVENWPGTESIQGMELMKQMHDQAEKLGAFFSSDSVEHINTNTWPFQVKTQNGDTIHAMAVIIAAGSVPRKLGVPGEQEYFGKGVTTCAVCDAPFYRNLSVVVVGGGDSAIEEAIQVAHYAKNVTILVRSDHMRATLVLQDRIAAYPNITVRYNVKIKEIKGNGSLVTGVVLEDSRDQSVQEIPIDGVFLAIGHLPNSHLVSSGIALTSGGYIATQGRSQETSISGIFAAGDVEDSHYRQAIVAAGSGVRAALDADEFLASIGWTPEAAKAFSTTLYRQDKNTGIELVATLPELKEILQKHSGVLAYFFSKNCPQCAQMNPVFEHVAQHHKDSWHAVSVDTDASTDIISEYFVDRVPSIRVFVRGDLVGQVAQSMTKEALNDYVDQFKTTEKK